MTGAVHNPIKIVSRFLFEDNQAFGPIAVGGLFIVGGENTSIPNGTSNNMVEVRLWGCRLSNNQLRDVYAVGARSNPQSIGIPGTNNRVTIELKGAGSNPINLVLENSIPDEPGGTNTVTITQ